MSTACEPQRQRTAVADIVHDVVAETAPDELPLAEGLRSTAHRRAARALARPRRPREPLGFGLDEVAVLVTPVVWIAVDEAVRRGVDGTVSGVWQRLRRLRRPRPAGPTVPPLTRGQLVVVRERVLDLAAKAGLERERAETLADRVVARLALESTAGRGGRAGPGEGGRDPGNPGAMGTAGPDDSSPQGTAGPDDSSPQGTAGPDDSSPQGTAAHPGEADPGTGTA